MRPIVSILFFLLALSAPISAQWISQNSGTSNTLNSVYFIDANNGWVVGENGTVLRTANGGDDWTSQNSRTNGDLKAVYFVDEKVGWIVGGEATIEGGGIILKTIDAGDNWIPQNSGTNNRLNSVYFTDANNGCAVGDKMTILRTTDSGSTWTPQNSEKEVYLLLSVGFTDTDTGWAAGNDNGAFEGTILKTTDGGEHWITITDKMSIYIRAAQFMDSSVGWVVGLGSASIMKTVDGGNNWTTQSTSGAIYGVYFTDVNTGWATGFNGSILATKNSGITWTPQNSTVNSDLYSVYFVDSNIGWTVGSNGTILKTIHGGTTSVSEKAPASASGHYVLYQNYPNPFNPSTKIQFSLPRSSYVTLKIYNTLGAEVATLVAENLTASKHRVAWNANDLPGGVYFYRLQSGNQIQTRKLLVLK